NGIDGSWGTIIPNNLTNGVRRFEQRSLADGSIVGCVSTDTDGIWPTGTVNTQSPTSGITPLVIDSYDVPFGAPALSYTATNGGAFCAGEPTQLDFTLSPSATYTWNTLAGLYTDAGADIAFDGLSNPSTLYGAPFINTSYSISGAYSSPNVSGCSASLTVPVTICIPLNDAYCSPSPILVGNTPTWSIYHNFGATTGLNTGAFSAPVSFSNDVWFQTNVPTNGELHVYTSSNGSAPLDLDGTIINIYTKNANPCTTAVWVNRAYNLDGGAGNFSYASASGLTPGTPVYIRIAYPSASPRSGYFKMAVTSGLIWTGALNNDFSNPGNWFNGDATSVTTPAAATSVIIPASPTNNYPVVYGTQNAHGIDFTNYSGYSSIPSISINTGAELRLTASATYKSFITKSG
ncbi:MAG TPA: hypothetical protein PL185_08730, partial [Flavobacteriales bacterium]|nr:hypothetical protein [Flavobacteriales bacterium]